MSNISNFWVRISTWIWFVKEEKRWVALTLKERVSKDIFHYYLTCSITILHTPTPSLAPLSFCTRHVYSHAHCILPPLPLIAFCTPSTQCTDNKINYTIFQLTNVASTRHRWQTEQYKSPMWQEALIAQMKLSVNFFYNFSTVNIMIIVGW